MPEEPRTDLNGLRLRLPGAAPIYLIDLGKRRHIPNPEVYNQIFSTWKGVFDDIDIDEIPLAEPIPETAILFRCFDNPKVFFLDGNPPNYEMRHIVAPAVMDRYKFDWGKIHVWNVPLDAIGYPHGDPIRNP